MEKNTVILRGSFIVEYSYSYDGDYLPYIRPSLYRDTPLSDFIAYIRRNLCAHPSWVRQQICFQHFSVRFWFRLSLGCAYIRFPVDISSADLNSCHSSREAAL